MTSASDMSRPRKRAKKRAKAAAAARKRMMLVTALLAVGAIGLAVVAYRALRSKPETEVADAGTKTDPSAKQGEKGVRPKPTEVPKKSNTPPDGPKTPPEAIPITEIPGRVLFVLPPHGLLLDDYLPVRHDLERAGYEVKLAGVSAEEIGWGFIREDGTIGFPPKGGKGPPKSGPPKGDRPPPPDRIVPDMLLSQVKIDDYAAVIFVGKRIDEFVPNGIAGKEVRKLIDGLSSRKEKRIVGAICGGVAILRGHNLLDGHKIAASKNYPTEGLTTEEKPVVVSLPFVTAKGPEAAHEFADTLVKELGGPR